MDILDQAFLLYATAFAVAMIPIALWDANRRTKSVVAMCVFCGISVLTQTTVLDALYELDFNYTYENATQALLETVTLKGDELELFRRLCWSANSDGRDPCVFLCINSMSASAMQTLGAPPADACAVVCNIIATNLAGWSQHAVYKGLTLAAEVMGHNVTEVQLQSIVSAIPMAVPYDTATAMVGVLVFLAMVDRNAVVAVLLAVGSVLYMPQVGLDWQRSVLGYVVYAGISAEPLTSTVLYTSLVGSTTFVLYALTPYVPYKKYTYFAVSFVLLFSASPLDVASTIVNLRIDGSGDTQGGLARFYAHRCSLQVLGLCFVAIMYARSVFSKALLSYMAIAFLLLTEMTLYGSTFVFYLLCACVVTVVFSCDRLFPTMVEAQSRAGLYHLTAGCMMALPVAWNAQHSAMSYLLGFVIMSVGVPLVNWRRIELYLLRKIYHRICQDQPFSDDGQSEKQTPDNQTPDKRKRSGSRHRSKSSHRRSRSRRRSKSSHRRSRSRRRSRSSDSDTRCRRDRRSRRTSVGLALSEDAAQGDVSRVVDEAPAVEQIADDPPELAGHPHAE